MDKILKDKVIVVSGGTKGIGKAVILEAARQGAKVVIGGRDKQIAKEMLDEINAFGADGIFVYTELTDIHYCKELFDKALDRFNRVDGFVNYAGLTYAAALTECDEQTFDEVFDVNIKAAFFCAKYAVKAMQKSGGGSIVMFGSPHAWMGEKDRTAYACSKGALLTLTEHIAKYYGVDKIRSNYITMGWTLTEGEKTLREAQGMNENEVRNLAANFIPMGRMQEVDDHVPGVIYLLSDYSTMVSGANLRVTGGWFI